MRSRKLINQFVFGVLCSGKGVSCLTGKRYPMGSVCKPHGKGRGAFFILILAIWAVVLSSSTSIASVSEIWTDVIDGDAAGSDLSAAVAYDQSGNAYVAGLVTNSASGSDALLVKYDASGTPLWTVTYDGPTSGSDTARALAIDPAGNAYLAISSYDASTFSPTIVVRKYTSSGTLSWSNSFAAFDTIMQQDIAVDAAGNVYAMSAYGALYNYTVRVTKYDSSGTEQWNVGRPGSSDNLPDMAIGLSGSVYIAVTNKVHTGYFDYEVSKYDTNGTNLWTVFYNGPSNTFDGVSAIAVDSNDNAYVTGRSAGNNAEFATIKYDPNGVQMWVARHLTPSTGADIPSDIMIDSMGNIYVTGTVFVELLPGFVQINAVTTIKYDSAGNELWVASHQYTHTASNDGLGSLAIDSSDDVYLAVVTRDSGPAYKVFKYNKGGSVEWEWSYSWPDGSGSDYIRAIDASSMDRVIVTGTAHRTGSDYAIVTVQLGVPAELPRTGQTTCYDSAGAVIPCAGTCRLFPWDNKDMAGRPRLCGLLKYQCLPWLHRLASAQRQRA